MLCENDMERLATEDPAELLRYVREEKPRPSNLTFALEHLGTAGRNGVDVASTLVEHLAHESPGVREGALIGLVNLYRDHAIPGPVVEAVRRVARGDSSPAVRSVAGCVIEDLGEENSGGES